MITEPWQCLGADLGLPRVALRLLVQTDVRAQQWMHRNRATTMYWGFLTVARQQQRTMCPGRQRRVHQTPVWVEHREVHRGARAVQIRQKVAQSVRQRLLALAGKRVTHDGVLMITSRVHRTQEANRTEARARLDE